MSNVIQIKHGASAPGDGVLAPYELGYADDGGLYIGVPNGESTISKKINSASEGSNDLRDFIYEGKNAAGNNISYLNLANSVYASDSFISTDPDYVIPAILVLRSTSFSDHNIVSQMDINTFISRWGFVTSDNLIIESNNYGNEDPNIANISGKQGQLYFVIQE